MRSTKATGSCWTCRLRRVSCDKAAPACAACTSRHIKCHGYGPQKPDWMDGGRREQEVHQRIKSAVKIHTRSRKLQLYALARSQQQQAARSQSPLPSSSGSDRSVVVRRGDGPLLSASASASPLAIASPAAVVEGSPDTASSCGSEQQQRPGRVERGSESATPDLGRAETPYHSLPSSAHGEHSHSHWPLSHRTAAATAFSRGALPYDEAELLMYYLDHVFPMQYPYHSARTKSRGWLLWLLSKNGPLYRASLSLAALHQRLVSVGGEGEDVPFEYHNSTLRELQDFIGAATMDGLPSGDELCAEIVACGAALVSFEVFTGGTENWQPHLQSTVSILKTIDPSRLTANPSQRSNGVDAALAFHAPVLLWMDILSCIATCQKPQLPYDDWLSSSHDIDLAQIMGCQNWAMKAIGDLATLQEWKMESLTSGTFRVEEFTTKAQWIENELENGIEALQLTKEVSSERAEDKAVTLVFATAALVQLYTIGVDVLHPQPSKRRRVVARVMQQVERASGLVSVRQIVWPICVAGCVAEPHQQPFFEESVADVLQKPEEVHWDCSKTLARMNMSALLI
ncbi:hypothetical protein BFW01_g7525 [Lasiodiplodia theobromae]|nr:hypothetical protein BFW01_g7525 [Lasiodiplodia theobromae]